MQLRAFQLGLALVALTATSSCARPSDTTPTTSANPLEGVWSVTAIEPEDGSAVIDPAQPGLYIFARDHYSAVWTPGAALRTPSAAPFAPTPEEMVAQHESIIVNAGTYEISGSTVTFRPMIAKSPDFVGGQSGASFQIEGDVLTLRTRNVTGASGTSAPNVGGSMTLLRLE